MAYRITITPEQVRGVASQFRAKSQESLSMTQFLDGKVKEMQPQWEGMTSQRFYSDFETWKQQMQKHSELLENIAVQLENAATKFEQVDK
jgi:WXG100 family type VII secretion target